MKEDLNKRRDMPRSGLEGSVLLRWQSFPATNSVQFLPKSTALKKKWILKCLWKGKGIRITKTIFTEKEWENLHCLISKRA